MTGNMGVVGALKPRGPQRGSCETPGHEWEERERETAFSTRLLRAWPRPPLGTHTGGPLGINLQGIDRRARRAPHTHTQTYTQPLGVVTITLLLFLSP